jgi:hypothetical protein
MKTTTGPKFKTKTWPNKICYLTNKTKGYPSMTNAAKLSTNLQVPFSPKAKTIPYCERESLLFNSKKNGCKDNSLYKKIETSKTLKMLTTLDFKSNCSNNNLVGFQRMTAMLHRLQPVLGSNKLD